MLVVQVPSDCEAGVSMEHEVERGFASETSGMRAEIYCLLKAGERTVKQQPESAIYWT